MIIAVDVGTTATKAAAISSDGCIAATAVRATRLDRYPDGRVEQDVDMMIAAVGEVVREVAKAAEEPDAIAVTGQGDGVWLRDERGGAVRPAISWLDARAAGIVGDWMADGTFDAVYRRQGSAVFPGSSGPLLRWLEDHDPGSLRRAAVAGYCTDTVVHRLTGRITVDASDASMPFLDVRTRTYDDAAMQLMGLSGVGRLLAEPQAPGTVWGLDHEGAELTGLRVGTPVVAAPYDLVSGAIGAGAPKAGAGTVILGTTLACEVWTGEAPAPRGDPAGMWLAGPDPELLLRVMPSMVGTSAIDWILQMVGAGHADLDALIAASSPGARGVRTLSFLSPSGERAPFVSLGIRGRIDGLSLLAGRADLVRSVAEALAFAARHCLERAGLSGPVRVIGGGARSLELRKILASVLGVELEVADEWAGARGAAQVAAASLGHGTTRADAVERIAPDPGSIEPYDALYRDYRRRVDAARSYSAEGPTGTTST